MASLKDKKLLRELGNRVREKRKARGWTQQQFAEQSGLHRAYVAGIERGERNVTILSLKKLADVLRASLAELLS